MLDTKERFDKKKYNKEWMKKWRCANREKARAICFKYRAKNRDKLARGCCIDRIKRKFRVFKLLGGKCVRCGIDDIRLLTLNHKKGGGIKHRQKLAAERKSRFWSGFHTVIYQRIIDGKEQKEDFDVRCFNCNQIYEYERGRLKYPKNLSTNVKEIPCRFLFRLKKI